MPEQSSMTKHMHITSPWSHHDIADRTGISASPNQRRPLLTRKKAQDTIKHKTREKATATTQTNQSAIFFFKPVFQMSQDLGPTESSSDQEQGRSPGPGSWIMNDTFRHHHLSPFFLSEMIPNTRSNKSSWFPPTHWTTQHASNIVQPASQPNSQNPVHLQGSIQYWRLTRYLPTQYLLQYHTRYAIRVQSTYKVPSYSPFPTQWSR